jgi:hypothetical protein
LRDIEQNESIDISVPVKLWQMPGCHELLASLSFDLMEVGRNEVTLRTGTQANKRNIQFALQALLALFGKLSHLAAKLANDLFKFLCKSDTQEALKSLSLDSSRSLESLTSEEAEEEQHLVSHSGAGSVMNTSTRPPCRRAPAIVHRRSV